MFIYFSEMERRGRKRPLAADVDTVEKDPLKKILNCPDILEQIFKFTDIGTLIGSCALVCKQWNEVINGAPWYLLPKRHYKEIIISAQNELEIKLEPDVHCDNSPKTEAEAANPKKPRKLWKIIRREYPEQEDIPKLMRHLSCESLQFQSLGGAFLPWLLKELSKLLKNVERITFNFCNFQVRCQGAPLPSGALVNTVYIFQNTSKRRLRGFMRCRRNKLHEISIASCRNFEYCVSPREFLEYVGNLAGNRPVFRLRDHQNNSMWKNELAEAILNTRTFWLLDMDGVRISAKTLEDRLIRWLRPWEAIKKTGCPPLDIESLYDPESARKNVIIKIDNANIKLWSWWYKCLEILPYPVLALPAPDIPPEDRAPLGPHDWPCPPEVAPILEVCFDGQRRYSTYRKKIVISDQEGKRFSLYLQR